MSSDFQSNKGPPEKNRDQSTLYRMGLRDEGALSRAGTFGGWGSKSFASVHTAAELVLELNEGVPQITIKAIIAGLLSGVVCSFLALYYGLKTGITPSLNILGGVLGFGVTKALMKTGWFGNVFTPQENAVIQTISVAAYSVSCPSFGFATGWLGLSKEAYEVVGAMEGNNPEDVVDLVWWRSVVWALSLFSFGFFLAYPLRNYYIIKKRLLFPSGTATAFVINSLHSSKGAASRGLSVISKYFSLAFIVNMITWCFDGLSDFPIFGMQANEYGWALDFDLGSFGIGLLLSLQVNASMLLGALVIFAGIEPWIMDYREGDWDGAWFNAATVPSDYMGLRAYSLFSGLAVMLVQGAWGILTVVYTVVSESMKERAALKANEVEESVVVDLMGERRDAKFTAEGFPLWSTILGYCCSGAMCIIVMHFMLDTKWYQTLIALILVPILAVANIEGMGRTDWDVASSYGKLMMFPIGAWNRGGSIIPAISICHTTISGCSNSAMLMQDFKTGYLLGADPTTMFYAQILGTFCGCFITPSLFLLLRSVWDIPSADPHAFIPGVYGKVFRILAVVATGAGFEALPSKMLAH